MERPKRVRLWPCRLKSAEPTLRRANVWRNASAPIMPKLRDTMREVAAQWRQLAADVEARRKNPEVNSQRGRAPQIRDTPQRPGSPPANFVLLVGLQNRQIARGERQKIPCRLDLGAELTDEFWSEIGRKPRVFDMTVERERDREIPKAVRSL